jgi:cytochrome c553
LKLPTAPALGSFAVYTVATLLFSLATRAQDPNFHNAPPSARELKNPSESLQIGTAQSLYHRRCAECHGENGEGLGNIPALATGRAQSASEGELFWYITQGDANNGMPSWAKLSPRSVTPGAVRTAKRLKHARAFYTRHELLRQVRDFHCPLELRATLTRTPEWWKVCPYSSRWPWRMPVTPKSSTRSRRLPGGAPFQQPQCRLGYGKLCVATMQANDQGREEPNMRFIETLQSRKMDGDLCGKRASRV